MNVIHYFLKNVISLCIAQRVHSYNVSSLEQKG